jgi:hypothetical protein
MGKPMANPKQALLYSNTVPSGNKGMGGRVKEINNENDNDEWQI